MPFPSDAVIFSVKVVLGSACAASRGGAILRYLFEEFALDTERRELRRGDALVAIEPMIFDLLVYVVVNRQRVVSRDDLIAHVWDGRIVSESALARCINGARSAIGDSGETQRLIKTLPRKGLRFVGAVREEQQPSEVAEAGTKPEKPAAPLPLPDRASIAVLPFENISGDKSQDYFCDGITEDIITELSRFSELFVIARNSSFQYKGKAADVRQVGRELGVRYILQGSIRRGGDRVRISVQLADAATGAHRWAERYDRQLEDVFAVQDEVARTIVAILAAQINKAEIERSYARPSAPWQAYDCYMRAAGILSSYLSSFELDVLYESRRLLEQTLSVDPMYARAYALLSFTHLITWINPFDEDFLNFAALDRSVQLAHKAVQIDHNLPQAHANLGVVLAHKHQHDDAIAAFERAFALNSNFTDWRFARALVFAGQSERAIEVIEAYKRRDPFYPPWPLTYLGFALYTLKRYSEALVPLRECAARAPKMRTTHVWLAATYAQLGLMGDARLEVAEVLRLEPTYTIAGTAKKLVAFKFPQDAENYFGGLRKAGFPE